MQHNKRKGDRRRENVRRRFENRLVSSVTLGKFRYSRISLHLTKHRVIQPQLRPCHGAILSPMNASHSQLNQSIAGDLVEICWESKSRNYSNYHSYT
jgi:hypothetical protein